MTFVVLSLIPETLDWCGLKMRDGRVGVIPEHDSYCLPGEETWPDEPSDNLNMIFRFEHSADIYYGIAHSADWMDAVPNTTE